MKLFQRIAAAISIIRSGGPTIQEFLTGEEVSGKGANMINGYEQSTWVYAAVNALAKNVSQIPFRIVVGDPADEDILTKGPIIDLFKKPHQFLDRFQFWELLITWLMIRGEAFVVALDKDNNVMAVRDAGPRRQIAQLLVLSPDRFWHIIDGDTLVGWRYTGMNYNEPPMESQIFLPEEVMQLRLINPFLFWRGMSPLSVAMLAASTDYASAKFMKGLMLNNADTGVIVTTDQQPAADQRAAILSALKERKRQAGTADRPLFLWGGAKLEKPTISSADMQFLENRKLNRLEIGSVYGVPSTVMGFSEDANRAIAGQERLNFIEQSISPLCARLEAFVEPIAIAFDKSYSARFHLDSLPIMQQARRDRGAAATAFFQMGVPLNDVSKLCALGLPIYPWGDTGFIPFNLQPAGSKITPPDAEPDDDDEPEKSAPLDAMFKILKAVKEAPAPKAPGKPEPHVCAASAEYEASIAGSVKVKKGKLQKLFFEQRVRTLAKLGDIHKIYKESSTLAFSDYLSCTKSIDDVFDPDAENAELLSKMKPLQIADLEFGGAQIFQQLGLGDFNLAPADAIAFLDKRQNKLTDVNQTTFDNLKTSLQEGLSNGETMDELTDRVKQIFQSAIDNRAESIATTETNTAVNAGRFNAMGQAKVEKKGWQTSSLENVRPTHQAAAAEYQGGIPIDEPFVVGGAKLMHPGDPDGPPQEVINCRCFTFAVVGDKAVHGKLLKWEEFKK